MDRGVWKCQLCKFGTIYGRYLSLECIHNTYIAVVSSHSRDKESAREQPCTPAMRAQSGEVVVAVAALLV